MSVSIIGVCAYCECECKNKKNKKITETKEYIQVFAFSDSSMSFFYMNEHSNVLCCFCCQWKSLPRTVNILKLKPFSIYIFLLLLVLYFPCFLSWLSIHFGFDDILKCQIIRVNITNFCLTYLFVERKNRIKQFLHFSDDFFFSFSCFTRSRAFVSFSKVKVSKWTK